MLNDAARNMLEFWGITLPPKVDTATRRASRPAPQPPMATPTAVQRAATPSAPQSSRPAVPAAPVQRPAAAAARPATSSAPTTSRTPIPVPPVRSDAPPGSRQHKLDTLKSSLANCAACGLAGDRTNLVFGEGNPDAEIVFVGEAPGFEEDKSGRPFVGRAGQLLTDIITKGMGIPREQVYICNVLKCRPPQNRPPQPQEIVACSPALFQQLRIIQPKVIIALGSPASKTLLETQESISRIRGQFQDFRCGDANGPVFCPVMPTYHPAYLLRNPSAKAMVWEDIKKVLAYLNMPRPGKAS